MNRIFFLISVLIVVISACTNTEEQVNFEKDAFKTPVSFTETNSAGEIISRDNDDWRVSPLYVNVVEVFRPAYPNPTVVQNVTIEFLVSGIESVLISNRYISFSWSSGQTTDDITSVLPGDYVLQVENIDQCSSFESFTVEQQLPGETSICMIDVDTTTGTNLVVWTPLLDDNIESYNIGVFCEIG